MPKYVSDDQPENETHAKIQAEIMTRPLQNTIAEEKKRQGKKLMRCPICGQTGWSREYPFSTCPPICDDCN